MTPKPTKSPSANPKPQTPLIPHNVAVQWREDGLLLVPLDAKGKPGKAWFIGHEMADSLMDIMIAQHDKLFPADAPAEKTGKGNEQEFI